MFFIGVFAFILMRQRLQADEFGPLVAFCPGPDFYGYLCESGTAVAYVDATNDTELYQLDGITSLKLPFPFTFYGTTYTEVNASSNGNLQFGNDNPLYINSCLNNGPANNMGDMIAPYWDDLDLRAFGYLETELVGEEPNRIFVVEWDDVPRFDTGEPVTFEVQLFEGSNNIVFLYENVEQSAGGNGRSATIGLQSEAQDLSLQFGCNLPVVNSISQLQFTHPDQANGNVGLSAPPVTVEQLYVPTAKGDTAVLIEQMNVVGAAALTELHRSWLTQNPPITAVWQRADLIGDGREELVILRHSSSQYPHLSQLIVLGQDDAGQAFLLLDQAFSTRQQAIPKMVVEHIGDLTADGQTDILLASPDTGILQVLTAVNDTLTLQSVPAQCSGSLAVIDGEIVRDGCTDDGRLFTSWNGQEFSNSH